MASLTVYTIAMSALDFGLGLYTAPEAARMIGMHTGTLRRWLLGYDHNGVRERPLWQPQYKVDEDGLYMGFRDLIEARIVNALRREQIGLPTIRKCIDRAREIIGDERPFSTRDFRTDGKSIFLQITRDLDEVLLIDLRRSQGVFRTIVEPTLKDLDFGELGAERWWLLPGKKTIVADPLRSFGRPITSEAGIATSVLAEAVDAEGSVEKVARLFEVPNSVVRDALAYEQGIHSKKAA